MSIHQLLDMGPFYAQLVQVHDIYHYGTWGGTTSYEITPETDVVLLEPVSDEPPYSHKGRVTCPRCSQLVTIFLTHHPDPSEFRRYKRKQVGDTLLRLLFVALALWWIWYSWPALYQQTGPVVIVIQFLGLIVPFLLLALYTQTGEKPWGRQMICEPASIPDEKLGKPFVRCRHDSRCWPNDPGPSVRPQTASPAML